MSTMNDIQENITAVPLMASDNMAHNIRFKNLLFIIIIPPGF